MIEYEGRVFRPPSEAYSLIVQVTIGCSHNKCTFCDMYKEKRFRVRKLEEVKADFDEARRMYRRVSRIFLADGDALMCRPEHMAEILRYIKKLFPECERVTSYGSPASILCKKQEDLNMLHDLGLEMIYLGLESGSDEVLRRVNKGETADEIVRAGLMVKEAGILISDIDPEDVDMPFGTMAGAGVIFGTTGGVTEAVLRHISDNKRGNGIEYQSVRGLKGVKEVDIPFGEKTLHIGVVSGLGNAEKLIERVKAGEHFDFIEVMACPGGCINGAGQPFVHEAEKQARSHGLYNADRMCSIKSSEENPLMTSLYDGLLKGKVHELLHVEYKK